MPCPKCGWTPPPDLTPVKAQILKFMKAYRETCGFNPTIREIAEEIGNASPTIHTHLQELVARGSVLKSKHTHRCYRAL